MAWHFMGIDWQQTILNKYKPYLVSLSSDQIGQAVIFGWYF